MLSLEPADSITLSMDPTIDERTIVDYEELYEIQQLLKNQYENLENMGSNLLEEVEPKYLVPLFDEMIDFISSNYTAIINYDDAKISSNKTVEIGWLVYKFFVVDGPGTIIPNYMETNNISSVNELDLLLAKKFNNDISNFKTSLVKIIKSIIDQLQKLQLLDKTIIKNHNYQELLNRYGFYLELINYGDSLNFFENYMRRVVWKKSKGE